MIGWLSICLQTPGLPSLKTQALLDALAQRLKGLLNTQQTPGLGSHLSGLHSEWLTILYRSGTVKDATS